MEPVLLKYGLLVVNENEICDLFMRELEVSKFSLCSFYYQCSNTHTNKMNSL